MRNNLVIKALEMAVAAHQGQKRIGGQDYIIHPLRCSEYLRNLLLEFPSLNYYWETSTQELLSTMLLHDTIEDTEVNREDIEQKINKTVADLVLELTSDEKEIKKLGKAVYLTQKINCMSWPARILKLIDRYDNISGSFRSGEFFDKYTKETREILSGLMIDTELPEETLIVYNKLIFSIKNALDNPILCAK